MTEFKTCHICNGLYKRICLREHNQKCDYCGLDKKTNYNIANCIGIGLHSWTLPYLGIGKVIKQ